VLLNSVFYYYGELMKKTLMLVLGRNCLSLSYGLKHIVEEANIKVYATSELPSYILPQLSSFDVFQSRYAYDTDIRISDVIDEATVVAQRVGADGILTMDESCVRIAAAAATKRGFPGPGLYADFSKNKLAMRQAFEACAVPSTPFRAVSSVDDLINAGNDLGYPLLLKTTEGFGSFGHTLVSSKAEAVSIFSGMNERMLAAIKSKTLGPLENSFATQLIAESLIEATTNSWFEDDRYGDYLSVEGMVIKGQYSPLAITTRLPTAPGFMETGLQSPCVLSRDKQLLLAAAAKQAVDALRLDTCMTHTEIKLKNNNRWCLLENAARVPGVAIGRLIEASYGINLYKIAAQLALGITPMEETHFPLSPKGTAVGSVVIAPINAAGKPWATKPYFNTQLDWPKILPKTVHAEASWSTNLQPGEPVPEYDPSGGVKNFLGGVFLRTNSPQNLIEAQVAVLNKTEMLMNAANAAVGNT